MRPTRARICPALRLRTAAPSRRVHGSAVACLAGTVSVATNRSTSTATGRQCRRSISLLALWSRTAAPSQHLGPGFPRRRPLRLPLRSHAAAPSRRRPEDVRVRPQRLPLRLGTAAPSRLVIVRLVHKHVFLIRGHMCAAPSWAFRVASIERRHFLLL